MVVKVKHHLLKPKIESVNMTSFLGESLRLTAEPAVRMLVITLLYLKFYFTIKMNVSKRSQSF